MNIRMTVYILGLLLMFEGVFMAVPTLTARRSGSSPRSHCSV